MVTSRVEIKESVLSKVVNGVSQSVFNKKDLFLPGKKIFSNLRRLNEELRPEFHRK